MSIKEGEKMKVFLGGTCTSNWRDKLIPLLKIDYFNPIVDDWNEERRKLEVSERENSDICLYVITPKMKGYYSIAEIIDDSNKRPSKTVLCVLENDEGDTFDKNELYSFEAIKNLAKENGITVLDSIQDIANYLNGYEIDIST